MNSRRIVGRGNTATIYEWEDGKVLKLFHPGYPKSSVETEYHNIVAIQDMNFDKPRAYEILTLEQQYGIVYDSVEGEDLQDYVLRTGDIELCAEYMARIHKTILSCEVDKVPNYKDFLKYNICHSEKVSLAKKDETLDILKQLPEGDTLCHGDFHPGNIIVKDNYPVVIDFMNICKGPYLYDIARTVYLVEYTPVPVNTQNREMIITLKHTLAENYLQLMNVSRARIKDFLTVISIARTGECPNEEVIQL
jgi:uncharacterized protein (TIGR02172 family)